MIEVEALNRFIALHYGLEKYDCIRDQQWEEESIHLIPVTGLPPNEFDLSLLRNLEANLKAGYTLLAIMTDLGYRGVIQDNLYLVTCD